MRFEVKTTAAAATKTDCLVLPVYSDKPLSGAARSIDSACNGQLRELIDSGDFNSKIGASILLRPDGSIAADSLLLIGCGAKGEFDRKAYRKALQSSFAALAKTRRKSAVTCLPAESVKGADATRRARIAVELWHGSNYRYTATKSDNNSKSVKLNSLGILARSAQAGQVRKGIKLGDALGQGIALTRELGNLPANICTPGYLASQARSIARGKPKLSVQVLDEKEMKKLGMGALLSVTAGTTEPAKFIILKYNGAAKSRRPIVLVGKGITFDTGGISLKPPGAMDEMKYDMCGAATVLGVCHAVTTTDAAVNLIGIIPTCENLPSGNATRPGDVVTSMSGQTIEILNTDAEGRLILCDALSYAEKKFKPAAIIDIATLTGACLVALGRLRSGLMSNSDDLAQSLHKSGEAADDPVWRLPLDDEYNQLLKSNFADVANVGGRDAGTITAGCFLSRFIEKSDWAHLDIAGTAWRTGASKGATGRPVGLLFEYVLGKH